MKRRIIFSLISLILAVAMVITALSSCSADNSSLILCNVKLEEDEGSRRLTSISTSATITDEKMHYYPEYLGSGSCYPNIVGNDYIEYNKDNGILLSQGLWNIKCKWINKAGSTVLEGETGPIWINLNTQVIYVHCGSSSFSLTYSVISNSISSPFLSLSIFPFENGNISETPLASYNNIKVEDTSKLSSVKTGNKTVFTLDDSSFNESGYFVLVITVKESESSSTVMFTDVIGFTSKPGSSPTLKGSCEVEEGSSGGSSVYLPEISDPTNPDETEVVNVNNNGSNTANEQLNKIEIDDNMVYVVNKDDNQSTTGYAPSPSMILGHTGTGSDSFQTVRIKPPKDADFGINLNGTNVLLTTESGKKYYHESSAVIELNTGSSMTLYNHNGYESGVEAGWAYMNGTRRFDANALLNGGTINIVGSNASDNISNAKVLFIGPSAADNEKTILGISEAGAGEYTKQGAINIYSSASSTGGNVVLDGLVEVMAVTGVSTWETKQTGIYPNYSKESTINGNLITKISILNKAKISATGDASNGVKQDTATGIYILGNTTYGGTIDIVLDDGQISASGSSSKEEAGIRIENFAGTINIELKNESKISSNNGSAIILNNCTGNINISLNKSSITSNNGSAIVLDKCTGTITITKDSNSSITRATSGDNVYALKLANGSKVTYNNGTEPITKSQASL